MWEERFRRGERGGSGPSQWVDGDRRRDGGADLLGGEEERAQIAVRGDSCDEVIEDAPSQLGIPPAGGRVQAAVVPRVVVTSRRHGDVLTCDRHDAGQPSGLYLRERR